MGTHPIFESDFDCLTEKHRFGPKEGSGGRTPMNIFRYVGNAIGGVNYTPTNSAIDVVVIEQPDGTLLGSPFHVNFGVRSVLHATDKKSIHNCKWRENRN